MTQVNSAFTVRPSTTKLTDTGLVTGVWVNGTCTEIITRGLRGLIAKDYRYTTYGGSIGEREGERRERERERKGEREREGGREREREREKEGGREGRRERKREGRRQRMKAKTIDGT